jgi:hypothetical protein
MLIASASPGSNTTGVADIDLFVPPEYPALGYGARDYSDEC